MQTVSDTGADKTAFLILVCERHHLLSLFYILPHVLSQLALWGIQVPRFADLETRGNLVLDHFVSSSAYHSRKAAYS